MKHCCCCCVCLVNLCYGCYFLFSFAMGNITSHLSLLLDCLRLAAQTLTGEHKVLGIVIIKNMEISLAKFIGNHLAIVYV